MVVPLFQTGWPRFENKSDSVAYLGLTEKLEILQSTSDGTVKLYSKASDGTDGTSVDL